MKRLNIVLIAGILLTCVSCAGLHTQADSGASSQAETTMQDVEKQAAPPDKKPEEAIAHATARTQSRPYPKTLAPVAKQPECPDEPSLEGEAYELPIASGPKRSSAGKYPNGPKRPGQETLDSALEFCQASDEYWERGDLDNALAALDQAYSLILEISPRSHPDILQQRDDLRAAISKRIMQVYTSRFTVANGLQTAIPLDTNRHVDEALALLKGKERDFFIAAYRRSGKYRPAMLEALKQAGLPEELSWLPLIESGFKTRALSKARALGPWQFIASTGYKYGLKRDRWTDERMDPEKSTAAAIAYLTELHQIFGDWTTALAAYNCGEGRVLSVINEQKINYLDNFWDLYQRLPQETAFYVPKFMAVLHVIKDPAAHGFELPPVDPALTWEKVTIDKPVHLKPLAERIGAGCDELFELNPELRYDTTPTRPYELKVPPGKGPVLLAAIDEILEWQPPPPQVARAGRPSGPHLSHQVKKGETLSGIAKKYGTSVDAILRANGMKKNATLLAGATIKVPGRAVYAAAAPEESKAAPPVKSGAPSGTIITYKVQKGDSLFSIANKNATTVQAIQALNNLRGTALQVGQILKIREEASPVAAMKTRSYTVRKGESPFFIAQKHEMDLSEFLTLNRLTPRSTIFAGQVLKVKAE